MSELVRFGIAIDDGLLTEFDRRIAEKGYANRSEAIRDLIRADLAQSVSDSDAFVHAALTLVYDHHVRELTERLTEIQHGLGEAVVSTMHVHVDPLHCLEVVVLRGPAGALARAADQMLALKGVRQGRLTLTSLPASIESSASFHTHAGHTHAGHTHAGHTHAGHTHEGHAHAPPVPTPDAPKRAARARTKVKPPSAPKDVASPRRR
jgi:CopG family nickel-responsive transcriptional regulator